MSYSMIPDGDEKIVQAQVKGSRWIRLVGGGRGIPIIDLQESKMRRYDDPTGPGTCANLFTFVGEAAQKLQSAAGPLTEFNQLRPSDA